VAHTWYGTYDVTSMLFFVADAWADFFVRRGDSVEPDSRSSLPFDRRIFLANGNTEMQHQHCDAASVLPICKKDCVIERQTAPAIRLHTITPAYEKSAQASATKSITGHIIGAVPRVCHIY